MLEVKETLTKEIRNLKDYILLVTVNANNYQNTVTDILNFLINKQNVPGVYVTLNKPYEIIERNLLSKNIDPRLIIFIDATSRTQKTKKIKNCLYIGSPEKLSDISVAMDQAVKALPSSEKFLIFDSLNTLAIFNKPATVARFVYFLNGKLREWKVKGVIITLKKETDQTLLDELTQFSDAKLDLGGGP
ncbi:hypothetical protein CMO83_00475 [Candidatus Woesearchaeota archaeon]|jgi:KaiC/GvpD/RAD55 family RecA-like ATPase|nr:hypothetical protein [Candidatus Woesearchaeota archaeon]|tara:strand:- start:14518 stop:15084 length:567 start_codon:yes stop_codon:yes gene_type:complete